MRRASKICPLMYWHLSVKSSSKVDHIHNDATNMNQNRKVADFCRLLNERQFQMSASEKSWSKLWHAFLKTEYWHIFAAQRIFLCAKVFAKWVGCRPKLFHFPAAAQCAAVCRVYCWRGFVTFGESGFLSWSLVMYCNYCKYLLLVFVV